MECPACESTNVHRSRRAGMVERWVLSPAFIAPYRCSDCHARFTRFALASRRRMLRFVARPPLATRLVLWALLLLAVTVVVGGLVVLYTAVPPPPK
jgi:transposase-like protein